MGMSIRQYKVKKEKIEKQNFSIEDFTWRFNHFVSNPKELKMTGFVGKYMEICFGSNIIQNM